jgi:hypothetical protein
MILLEPGNRILGETVAAQLKTPSVRTSKQRERQPRAARHEQSRDQPTGQMTATVGSICV